MSIPSLKQSLIYLMHDHGWLHAKPVNSNFFWQICFQTSEKITRLQGTIKNTVKLKICKFTFSEQKSSSERTSAYWQSTEQWPAFNFFVPALLGIVSLLQSFWDQVPCLQSFLSGMLFPLYESFE